MGKYIKICGLRTTVDALICNKYRPDFAGFVFANSKRRISFQQAKILREYLDSDIKIVGVFVNEMIDKIVYLCEEGVIDYIQLHGEEDSVYINNLKSKCSNKVIKAVRVKDQQAILEAELLPCDYLLLDTYVEGVAGGTGKAFDYSIIPFITRPYFLAGGLDVSNVENALDTEAYAADVSRGVEENGAKSEETIKQFIKKVRV